MQVLSKGAVELFFFGTVFMISMFAFSNMFYVQLGPVMQDFNDQPASMISLVRALFGDFDVDDIMDNSSGYLNALLFLIYLFVAIFIVLSMFLAILGENQAEVRSDQQEKKMNTPNDQQIPELGIISYAARYTKLGAVAAKELLSKDTAKVSLLNAPPFEDDQWGVRYQESNSGPPNP